MQLLSLVVYKFNLDCDYFHGDWFLNIVVLLIKSNHHNRPSMNIPILMIITTQIITLPIGHEWQC